VVREWFGGRPNLKQKRDPRRSRIRWVMPAENPWGVPVLDVRPVTLTTMSSSSDPCCAANAISFGSDDGTGFIGRPPIVDRAVKADLHFSSERILADGVLFAPRQMEEKWALFYHRQRIICVRSWTRQVWAIAAVEPHDGYVRIASIRGVLTGPDEEPEMTARVLEFLLISHALDMVFPAPLPRGSGTRSAESRIDGSVCHAAELGATAAMAAICMSAFGRRAHFAAAERVERPSLDRPLRTDSLLHIAAARGDLAAVDSLLSLGLPVDLRSRSGAAPLHWAAAAGTREVIDCLLGQGASVDVLSEAGSTPMMTAVQAGDAVSAGLLLDRGADIDACDRRGYTALHRAAERGQLQTARMLLERGADPNARAEGRTALGVAEACGAAGVAALLRRAG